MTNRRRGRRGRPAFTLIELLVVISIIAILMGLTLAAVMRALVKGPEIQTTTEINEFSTKLSAEQRDLNTKILPSHLRLREDNKYTGGATLAIQAEYDQTKKFLQKAFGIHITDPTVTIDWSGDGTIETTDLVLEGEQCLVFWLGGVPKYSGPNHTGNISMSGFPAMAGASARPTYFEFQTNRLKTFTSPGSTLPFPVYIDPWNAGVGKPWLTNTGAAATGMPYAFFASYQLEGNGLYQADCPSLAPLAAYAEPTGKFVNVGSFQIISAGRDGKFGAGGNTWNPAVGTSDPNGVDDWSNFSKGRLGVPAN